MRFWCAIDDASELEKEIKTLRLGKRPPNTRSVHGCIARTAGENCRYNRHHRSWHCMQITLTRDGELLHLWPTSIFGSVEVTESISFWKIFSGVTLLSCARL